MEMLISTLYVPMMVRPLGYPFSGLEWHTNHSMQLQVIILPPYGEAHLFFREYASELRIFVLRRSKTQGGSSPLPCRPTHLALASLAASSQSGREVTLSKCYPWAHSSPSTEWYILEVTALEINSATLKSLPNTSVSSPVFWIPTNCPRVLEHYGPLGAHHTQGSDMMISTPSEKKWSRWM